MKGRSFILTVAQSKRLIAKGVASLEMVRRAMKEGMVAVGKGSTNAYVLEELLGRKIAKEGYVSGRTLPASGPSPKIVFKDIPEVVFSKGKPVEGLSVVEAVKKMGPRDVFIKGANALNYRAKVAGILAGHGLGGTIGATVGPVEARRIKWIIPVGLEKEVPFDIFEVSRIVRDTNPEEGIPSLIPAWGEIFTEIEALQTLFGVEAVPIGAGGLLGAEGSIRLYIYGEDSRVDQAMELISEIQKEPSFGESAAN